MRLTDQQKKGGALVLTGILGVFTGTFLPPEVWAPILGLFG